MTDDIIPPNLNAEPLSADARMYLGQVGPWGNPSFLAAEMGADVEPMPWHPGMPPATFPCPCCTGTVTAAAHASVPGIFAFVCDRRCAAADVEAECRRRVPAALTYRDDLMPPMPPAMMAALEALLREGVVDATTHPTLGLTEAGKIVRVVQKMRSSAAATTLYPITNEQGAAVALVLRADIAASADRPAAKVICQVHAHRTAHGALEARLGLPAGPWPLVGRHLLAAAPEAPVLVVEGEVTREAAAPYAPGYVAVTSLCGAENAHVTDWLPLAGRQVTVLGDNDDAGRHYAASVAARALAAGAAAARLVALPANLPPKWDLADPLPANVTADTVRQAITDATPVTWEQVRHAMRRPRAEQERPPFRLPEGYLRARRHMRNAIEAALERISSGLRRGAWVRVLSGVHHMLGPDGLALAVTWSSRGDDVHGKFRPGEVEQLWAAFDADPYPTPMTTDELFWRAWHETCGKGNGKDGWRPDAEASADAAVFAFGAEHRKLVQGDNVFIASQRKLPDGRYEVRRMAERTAESIYRSRRTRDHDGKKMLPVLKLWEVDRDTKPLDVVFAPGEAASDREYNSFEGFAVRPHIGGSFKLYRELVERVQRDNEDSAGWLWNCMAYRVQNPGARMGSALCCVGPQGSGKTTLIGVMARLMDPHSVRLSDPQQFVGRFNACLEGKLFVACDEMTLGARPEWCDKLNNYVTEDVIGVEEKNQAQVQIRNRMWIAMTANRPEVVRVNKGERRYAMYRVNDPFGGDEVRRREHYGRLYAELEAGGYEALAYALLHHPIPTGFNRTAVPHTPFYRELVGTAVDRDPLPRWWQEVLEAGALPNNTRTARD